MDDPLIVQYLHYLKGLLTGDLGTSLASQLPVTDVVAQRLPATLALAVLAFLTAVVLAIPLGAAMGVLTRRGHGRRTELAFTTTSIITATIPDFLIGVALVYVFGIRLGWLPVAGDDTASSYVLPVFSLAIGRRRSWPASSASRWSRCWRRTSSAPRGPSAFPPGRSTWATPCPTPSRPR
ncbi:ABC transporter permease [Actinomadura madurae]|uniref:ABC transporter permease n=1 Tax=Actinomadura madurae TaxID=1993 RepID=UPI0020D23FD0|nr:ABC transporter permease [Actinomadura madurae]MCQ0010541.1 ABC transporter permease [Actinomadura madurae]MCQ0014149.1 ABC transporter permease [Actinomadura madurae]